MTSPAQLAANIANAQHSTGPTSDSGQAASSQNATKSGLFSNSDLIRPGEESIYTELDDALRKEIAPAGQLELHHVTEIRRAMWRLRRCGEIEASLGVSGLDASGKDAESDAKTQLSVDRARSQCHRLINKCTAELRALQTERHFRNEYFNGKPCKIALGVCHWRSISKGIDERTTAQLRYTKITELEQEAAIHNAIFTNRTQPQSSRNALCTCGSGKKYKRCCANVVTQAA